MNSELGEEYGAGFEGTNGLLYKYLKDTPGQKIVKHMNTKNTELEEIAPQLDEKIYADDYKISSEKSQFGGYRPHLINKRTGKTMYLGAASYKTPKEAEKHAKSYLDQYASGVSEPRVPVTGTYVKEGKMDASVDLEEADDFRTMKDDSLKQWLSKNDTDDSVSPVFGAQILAAKKEAKRRGISFTEGVAYGILKNSLNKLGFKEAPLRGFKDLPKEDIYTLYGIPMRAGKWADVWFASLEDMYAIINDEEVTMFDHMGNALKRLGQLGVQRESALEEGTQITAAQVEKYITTQDFEALADLSKHMSKDEYKTWSANGFEGRTYELLMKTRKYRKSLEEVGIQQKEETQISTSILRTMKIVSLATGCKSADALYEYALTSPTYSSIVELKENFNIYIQNK